MKDIEQVLIIGKVWPEPKSSAAGTRMMHLIRIFQSVGWKVTFASAASHSEFATDLTDFGVDTQPVLMNDASFDKFIKKLDPQLVVFDRFMTEEQFGWRVKEHCPDAMRILDTEDLHGLREARRIALKKGREFEPDDLHNDVAKREVASIFRCDLSLIISEAEMVVLKEQLGVNADLLYYLPLLSDVNNFRSSSEFTERQGFVTIGNFLHEPNRDSVQYLKNTIWPLIRRKLPDAQLSVYGAYPTQQVLQLHNEKDGFLIKGRADDAMEVIGKARVLVAPLRFGAGQKGKLLDAMISGTPSVTTTIGAEGMHNDLEWPGSIEDDPSDFADAAADLYQDEMKWHTAQNNCTPILRMIFHIDLHKDNLIDTIESTYRDLKQHRINNFTGSMLWHHSLAGTKYMGKWIEEKNRRET